MVEAAGVELEAFSGRLSPLPKSRARSRDLQSLYGGGGGSRTRVRKCYWSEDYMLIRVRSPWHHAFPRNPWTFAIGAQNGQETQTASLRS
jgi:hypothetical protein